MTTRQMASELLEAVERILSERGEIQGVVSVTTKLSNPTLQVSGIGTGAPYTSGDAFGTLLTIPAPQEGTIATVVFRDFDNEGLPKELWLFTKQFTATADNAAFAPTDADLASCIGVVSIATFYAANVNQLGIVTPALYYVAPDSVLYGQFVTRGADNIAAGSIPAISLVIV